MVIISHKPSQMMMMNIQQLIDSTNLDMKEHQVKAFFLGILCSEKPLPFSQALTELLSATPEAEAILEDCMKNLWEQLTKQRKNELQKMLPETTNLKSFFETTKDQLDFFLTGMSLSGTSVENCKDEGLKKFLNDLEDIVEDLEDFLSDEEASDDEGFAFKEYIIDTWSEFNNSRQ